LFSNNCRGNSIDTYVESETFDTERYKGIPYLDVTAVFSRENNAVYINVVNRHKDKSITADIINSSGVLAGKAEASLVANESLTEPFTYNRRDRYVPVTKGIQVEGNRISCSFPAHSFTQIKVGIKKWNSSPRWLPPPRAMNKKGKGEESQNVSQICDKILDNAGTTL
jgi:alpha-N-arabinofuranosidase